MSVINQNLLLTPEGYQISRSVRLRSSASAYFNRTPASASNKKTWTWSGWVKISALGVGDCGLFSASNGAANIMKIFLDGDKLRAQWYVTTSQFSCVTNALLRDPSAWYHIVVALDTTQATDSNRIKIYVNNVQQTFATSVYPALNAEPNINSTNGHRIGYLSDSSGSYFDGYLTEINFIDGQALTPSSFGETDALTGVWKPKKYGGTYGTNGFYLNFSDPSAATAAAIGKDSSGNGNNWTPNNISVTAGVTYDSMLDVPTMWADGGNGRGNYATLNPLINASNTVCSNGNLTAVTGVTDQYGTNGTIGITSDKYYWEVTIGSGGSSTVETMLGIRNASSTSYSGSDANSYGYYGYNGNKFNSGSNSAYGASYTANDVIGVAFDATAGTLSFYKNGTSQGTAYSSIPSNTWFPAFCDAATAQSVQMQVNFGQRPFAYAPPIGFKALNTQNLPDSTIKKGNQYFDATLYTGNAPSTNTVNNAGSFQPDLVWVKSRSAASTNHLLVDSSRGNTKVLYSNLTNAEDTSADYPSITSTGFTVGNTTWGNGSGATLVGWQWKESVSAGFDIVTYTGTGALRTIAHSLGVAPKMVIVKSRSAGSTNWCVQHASVGNNYVGYMNLTNAFTTNASMWNNTSPTSSVFTVNTNTDVNGNGTTYVAYLFAEVAGYSKFGSYTGNGSTDGPFVYLGFRPKFVMVKRTDSTSDWVLWDTSRSDYNAAQAPLYPNLSVAEGNSYFMDALSNGFKLRMSTITNVSSGTYIYAAFAENPTKYSLAR